jgi:hypothetical protein
MAGRCPEVAEEMDSRNNTTSPKSQLCFMKIKSTVLCLAVPAYARGIEAAVMQGRMPVFNDFVMKMIYAAGMSMKTRRRTLIFRWYSTHRTARAVRWSAGKHYKS